MSTTSRLAVRNLLRAPRRTVLTMTAVVAGVGLFILGKGFLAGITENLLTSAIEGTVGHVLARPADYPKQVGQHPVDVLLTIDDDTRALLDREAVAWTERTLFAPLVATGSDSMRVLAIGYDPERDPLVFPRTRWKIDGVLPKDGHQIAVSHRVARLLELELGSTLVLQVRTHRGAINALEVTVAGKTTTGNAALDGLGIFVPRSLAHELIASELPSHVAVKIDGRDGAPAFAAKLKQTLGERAEVVTWEDETRELIALQNVRQRALDLVMFILMALSAFGIANTILMAAHERVREIGTLRSMGMTEGGVVALFVLEGAMIGVLGSILGALWGGGLVAYWAQNPLDFTQELEQSTRGLSMSALVYTYFDPSMIAAAITIGVAVAMFASVYPARVASRMSPADAVRAT